MPFKSEAQRKLMWARHPAIARRWAKRYGNSPVAQKSLKNAALKSRPVISKGEPAPTPKPRQKPIPTPIPTPRQKPVGRRSPPIYQNPNQQPNPVVKPRPAPPSNPVVRPQNKQFPARQRTPSNVKTQQLQNALNRYRSGAQKRAAGGNTLDRVQKMQRQGLMIKNVGGADYTGPVNTRAQNLKENTRRLT